MMRRQRGFSLAEISMGVGIVVGLTTLGISAASYVQTKAKFQQLAEDARAMHNAISAYYSDASRFNTSEPTPPAWGAIGPLIGRYYTPPVVTADPEYFNPVSNAVDTPTKVTHDDGTVTVSAYPTGYASGNYPLASGMYGKIIYFWFYSNDGQATPYVMQIWDGVKQNNFRGWAVQAIDDKGYPLITLGR